MFIMQRTLCVKMHISIWIEMWNEYPLLRYIESNLSSLNYIVEWKLMFRIIVSFHGTKDYNLLFSFCLLIIPKLNCNNQANYIISHFLIKIIQLIIENIFILIGFLKFMLLILNNDDHVLFKHWIILNWLLLNI
jgi:hypothetical protein